MLTEDTARAQIACVLAGTETHCADILPLAHKGKVRDSYLAPDGRRAIVATDRISTFDFHTGCVPFKGRILSAMSAFWFDQTADIVPNHFCGLADPYVTLARTCTPLPVEMIVRGHMTGVTGTSIWRHYESGKRAFCGHVLPDGLQKNSRLPEPLVTPSTKESAPGRHDRSVSAETLAHESGLDPGLIARLSDIARALFARGTEIAARAGYILVDTKYEFGLDENGAITLIDEIHTPDSSRFWKADSYADNLAAGREMDYYDKEYVRLWLSARGLDDFGQEAQRRKQLPDELFVQTALRYATVYADITGQDTDFPAGDPAPGVAAALQQLRGGGAD